MNEIKNIFSQLENRTITLADAEKQISKLFESTKLQEPEYGGNTEQWVINANQKELEELRYFKQRYFDFWQWYEDEYGYTEAELWEEFEALEDEIAKI
jgi:hypothetical protein